MENKFKKILVTGGSGFIGSALIRFFLKNTDYVILNYDKLTYSGNNLSLSKYESNINYKFLQGDILDSKKLDETLKSFKPSVVMNLAAETHVDRSIENPSIFVNTNILGTSIILEAVLNFWDNLKYEEKDSFRFHHISTDEVYGSLDNNNKYFDEYSNYDPSSPYSASKASADHLVKAWFKTYGLPILLTNCSNNYGPYQFPEKLIPLAILSAIEQKDIPIYGNGKQQRDWLYVNDHASALHKVISEGKVGETYNIGGNNVKTNLEVVCEICNNLDIIYKNRGFKKTTKFSNLIKHVCDRPGHDQRYAINNNKIKNELNWEPKENFTSGIKETVRWYLNNIEWCKEVKRRSKYDGKRLGLKKLKL